MRGSVRRHGSGWQYTIEVGKDPVTNKRIQKSKGGFKTKKECEAEMSSLISKIENGEYIVEKKTTVAEYLNLWLDTIKPKVSKNTHFFYKRIVDKILIPNIGSIVLFKLKPMQIEALLRTQEDRKSINGTTLRHYYNVLNIALNQAVKWRLISYNPCMAVEPPKKEKKEMQVLTADEVDYLLSYLKDSEFKTLFMPVLLAVTCGLRRGEALGLKWENVDLENKFVKIKKSDNYTKVGNDNEFSNVKTEGSERTIPLLDITINELKEWKENQVKNDYVCTWDDGSLIRPDYVTQQYSRVIKKLPITKVRFHDLRHTYATLLLTQNVDIKITSALLGHSNLKTTEIYTHVLPNLKLRAANKLNSLFSTKKTDVVNPLSKG